MNTAYRVADDGYEIVGNLTEAIVRRDRRSVPVSVEPVLHNDVGQRPVLERFLAVHNARLWVTSSAHINSS